MSTSPKPRVLVLSFTPTASEPRALKQIARLSSDYDVTSAGFGAAGLAGVPHIELDPAPPKRGIMRLPFIYGISFMLRLYSIIALRAPRPADARIRLRDQHWDLIIAHDVVTVPLARSLKPTHGVLVDLHEYAPRQDEHSSYFRKVTAPYFKWILRKHVSKCAAVTTVSQGIVDEYRREFGIPSTLVINATPFRDWHPTETRTPIRLVHSGIAASHRKLELMVEGVRLSKADVTLDLFLVPSDPSYMDTLRSLAAADPRIRFNDPVPYAELVDTLHRFDVGLSIIAPTTFNLEWCLPNKFFDFVQARLGVITGPSPEMARLVGEHGFGDVTDDFTGASLARALDRLTPETVDSYKQASHRAAADLSGERQADVWAAVVAEVLQRPKV